MNENARAAIMGEIRELLAASVRDSYPQPNFTTAEMAEALGMSMDTARKRALQLVRSGTLQAEKVGIDGHMMWLFWKVAESGPK